MATTTSIGLNIDGWLKALEEAGQPTEDDQDAITIQDFMQMFDVHRETAVRRLALLERTGKAKRTWKRAHGADGRSMRLIAYRLVP